MSITASDTTTTFILDTKAPRWTATVTISNITSIGFQADWDAQAVDVYFYTYALHIRPIFQDGSLGDLFVWDIGEDLALGNIATPTTLVNKAPISKKWQVEFYAIDLYGWTKLLCTEVVDAKLTIPYSFRVESYTVT